MIAIVLIGEDGATAYALLEEVRSSDLLGSMCATCDSPMRVGQVWGWVYDGQGTGLPFCPRHIVGEVTLEVIFFRNEDEARGFFIGMQT